MMISKRKIVGNSYFSSGMTFRAFAANEFENNTDRVSAEETTFLKCCFSIISPPKNNF